MITTPPRGLGEEKAGATQRPWTEKRTAELKRLIHHVMAVSTVSEKN